MSSNRTTKLLQTQNSGSKSCRDSEQPKDHLGLFSGGILSARSLTKLPSELLGLPVFPPQRGAKSSTFLGWMGQSEELPKYLRGFGSANMVSQLCIGHTSCNRAVEPTKTALI